MRNRSVIEKWEERVGRSADSVFLRYQDTAMSFGLTDQLANCAAAGFYRLGVRSGHLVAIFMQNSPELLLAVLGLAKLGAVPVMINAQYKGHLLQYTIADCAATVIVTDESLQERIGAVAGQCPDLRTVVVSGEGYPFLPGLTTARFQELLRTPSLATYDLPKRADDLFVILYTSGTTGRSKGVMISNGHALNFANDWVRLMQFEGSDVLYSPLPLFHVLAFILGFLPCVIVGAQFVLDQRFSASTFWETVRVNRATVAHVIFSIVPMLLKSPPASADKDHWLRAVYLGPSRLSSAFEERFGVPVIEIYGQTETGIVTNGSIGAPAGSCGPVNSDRFQLQLVDDQDEPVGPGEVGEILVRPIQPNSILLGYLNKPEDTVVAFRNLWYRSGDRGRLDPEGNLYFVDRSKDCIRRSGENISSLEVEALVSTYPGILDCAAIPVPSDLEEEEVKICVVVEDPESFSYSGLFDHCERMLPAFMVPRYIELYRELPKTPSQKVEKHILKSQGSSGLTWKTWDATIGRMLADTGV